MENFRKVKILATLGPASSTKDCICALVKAGVNVFRLNFSHGVPEQHAENIQSIRQIEQEIGYPLGILADLQGPKLRVGTFQGNGKITLIEHQLFMLDLNSQAGNNDRVYFPHPEIYECLKENDSLLLCDGKITLKILKVCAGLIKSQVVIGGDLSSHQGVNIPNTLLPISTLTPKDRNDLKFIVTLDVDFIALSFVQQSADLYELKDIIAKLTPRNFQIFAKIEKPLAIENLDEIFQVADGVMVARGDLGVEFPPEQVPALQKKIIERGHLYGKPVIVATQMLESMIKSPSPTRAETSDVATAVYDGADCVMLSGESASGLYPIESVQMMERIIQSVENDSFYAKLMENMLPATESSVSDAITRSVKLLAQNLNAKVIITFTALGNTAKRAAQMRPRCPIIGLTPSLEIARSLTLVWGVYPKKISQEWNDRWTFDDLRYYCLKLCLEKGFAISQDRIILTLGLPLGKSGTTNSIHVETL